MPRAANDVRKVRFHNPRLAKVGVDVLSLEALRRRAGEVLYAPERPDFYVLMLVRAGSGRHRVDFVDHPLRKGDVLLVRPGQVQQWQARGGLQADLVLVSPEALAPFIARAESDMRLLALDEWPTVRRASAAAFSALLAQAARLGADVAAFQGDALAAALIWHELLALLLRIAGDRPASPRPTARQGREVHAMFLQEIERRLGNRRSVSAIAARLGYSESTLTRACLTAVGMTSKQVLDARIALEAKRLLVHSDASVAAIAQRLGFSEATNFVKFFRRLAGTSPMAFRAAQVM